MNRKYCCKKDDPSDPCDKTTLGNANTPVMCKIQIGNLFVTAPDDVGGRITLQRERCDDSQLWIVSTNFFPRPAELFIGIDSVLHQGYSLGLGSFTNEEGSPLRLSNMSAQYNTWRSCVFIAPTHALQNDFSRLYIGLCDGTLPGSELIQVDVDDRVQIAFVD